MAEHLPVKLELCVLRLVDCVAEIPISSTETITLQYKLLSEDPTNYADAPTEGIRRILEAVTGIAHPQSELIDSSRVASIRMATTVATNALLERKGEKVLLVTTKGFKDVLRIGTQARPNIFDLEIKDFDVLYDDVLEIDERVTVKGYSAGGDRTVVRSNSSYNCEDDEVVGLTGEVLTVLKRVDKDIVKQSLQNFYNRGFRSMAVVFLHSYSWPDHEKSVAEIAKQVGFNNVTLSSELMPMIKIVSRGMSTCVDAYLTPGIKRYLDGFVKGFDENLSRNVEVLFMQSDGGLTYVDKFSGFKAILSGPAAGVVGYALTSYKNQPVIGFDMGGTSTDVSRFSGSFDYTLETLTAGIPIQAPQLDIQTVASGGGSRLFFKNGMLVVGPDSAGADPGPACYRKGGPLAVTDANLVLGRVIPKYFPHIFGKTEDQPIDAEASKRLFGVMLDEIKNTSQTSQNKMMAPKSIEELAIGFIQVANEAMCRPIRQITHGKGIDPRNCVLSCFGGAGAQHACSIARKLGIKTVHVHRYSSVLSAFGLALAELAEESQEPAAFIYEEDLKTIKGRLRFLENETKKKFKVNAERKFHTYYYLNMRYEGTEGSLMVQGDSIEFDFQTAFESLHKKEFGFSFTNRRLLVDDLRVRVTQKIESTNIGTDEFQIAKSNKVQVGADSAMVYFENLGWLSCNVLMLDQLKPGDFINGPAIVLNNNLTILVEPHCDATISFGGHVVLTVTQDDSTSKAESSKLDPILLSIFSHRFMSIAEQMGKTLQRTSVSTNIRERLDFSCALFGPDGGLVANAPHIPVHLGSMQEAVKYQLKKRKDDLKPGDVLVSNHPNSGGSHLPDITVITPVFHNGQIVFFVASRGHHADIGGISPGSMPPHSKFLHQEGAIIDSFKLVENEVFQEEGITKILQYEPAQYEGCSGTRNLSDNLSDLKAQIAANNRGITLLQDLIQEYSLDVVTKYMMYIRQNAELAVRDLLREVCSKHGSHLEASESMDDGSVIKLKISIEEKNGTAKFDFTGSSEQVYGNLNAPPSVTYSAIIYCLRCLVKDDIPLNQGCLGPIETIIPEGSFLNPTADVGVVGGNVLTSQRLVDVILKAFKACAASQGCMNNLTFGEPSSSSNDGWGYYETIAGGSGAGPTWNGKSGVHTHMTNTRITDSEILERRYPVVLHEFSLRSDNSGGEGKFKGGEGIVRCIEFKKDIAVSILSERRVFAPYGLEGGLAAKTGSNLLLKGQEKINIGGKCSLLAKKGEKLLIKTPGGGGFGKIA